MEWNSSMLKFSRSKIPLVLDENRLFLKPELESKGFKIITYPQGMTDEELIEEKLPGRIFVTNNPRDFIYAASQQDFSIIDTKLVTDDPKGLAEIINRAWVDFELRARHPAFILSLRQDGNHQIRDL